MKAEHKQILKKIEKHLSQPGSEHLRFWQALRNMNLIVFEEVNRGIVKEYLPVDDYNISDDKLLKRIKG